MSKSVRELSDPIQLLQQECVAIVERNQRTLRSLSSEDASALVAEVSGIPLGCRVGRECGTSADRDCASYLRTPGSKPWWENFGVT